jgi:hypothetical protein
MFDGNVQSATSFSPKAVKISSQAQTPKIGNSPLSGSSPKAASISPAFSLGKSSPKVVTLNVAKSPKAEISSNTANVPTAYNAPAEETFQLVRSSLEENRIFDSFENITPQAVPAPFIISPSHAFASRRPYQLSCGSQPFPHVRSFVLLDFFSLFIWLLFLLFLIYLFILCIYLIKKFSSESCCSFCSILASHRFHHQVSSRKYNKTVGNLLHNKKSSSGGVGWIWRLFLSFFCDLCGYFHHTSRASPILRFH